MNNPTKPTGFTPKVMKQVHMHRSREILEKYPQIKQLYGPDIRLFYSVMLIVSIQFALSYYVAKNINSWGYFIFLAWSCGGILTHSLSLANHELGHNLGFKTPKYNEILGIFGNIAQGIPSFVAFKKYHFYHHYYLNEEMNDPDCPTRWEAETFNNPMMKAAWMLCQPLFYAIRPLVMLPKPASNKEVFNLCFVIGFDFWLILQGIIGSRIVVFNCLSTLLGMGIHPIAGHFISEHYDLYGDDNGQETYSYYGPLNYLTFNVGYHNEHHDFPRVSGFNLPKVTAIAPEYYMNLNPHHSWTVIVCYYIFGDNTGPCKRIIRKENTDFPLRSHACADTSSK